MSDDSTEEDSGSASNADFLLRHAAPGRIGLVAGGDAISDLIRKAQQDTVEIEAIRAALIEGERSGLSARGPEDIRAAVKKRKS